MKTKLIHASTEYTKAVNYAARLLRQGKLVVFPTETVYGLGANALSSSAVEKIFAAKGRPQDNPLITHIADMRQLSQVAAEVPDDALRLMERFWPGPLSIILPRRDSVPAMVSAGLDTIAVRMPANDIALAIIREAGLPVAAPSANTSGRPSPTLASHVFADLQGKVPLVIDGGPCEVGVESTVLNMTGPTPIILRPGSVTPEMIRQVVGRVALHPGMNEALSTEEACASPGMKYRHYSPRAAVNLFTGDKKEVEKNIKSMYDLSNKQGGRPVIFCTSDCAAPYGERNIVCLGENAEQVAASLYAALRHADDMQQDLILFHATDEMGLAVLNRIMRAAGGQHTMADLSPKNVGSARHE